MKKLAIICICFAAFVVAALAAVYDASNYSSLGRLYQPAPEGHVVGKDNGGGRGLHHPGEDCGKCHRVGGRAESYLFTMSGTLYNDRAGHSVARSGEIIMEDREGNIISMATNRTGSFWTYAPIASDPYTVLTTHGHEPFIPMYGWDSEENFVPADPDSSKTWKYKTWTRKGNFARPMVNIAPVGGGSPTTNRMSCNMHHGGVGQQRGALWGGRGPTLPFYPASDLSYRKHIYPILRSKCSCCHMPGRTMSFGFTKTDHDDPSTMVDCSGGLDLMTYGGSEVEAPIWDPVIPYKVIGYETISKVGVESVVDTANPQQSLLLQKTVPGALHGGGAYWNERDPDYIAIWQWIGEGALEN